MSASIKKITVKTGKPIGPIDPRIYGTNFLTIPELKTKTIRFGGNAVTRANPLNGKYNNSFDWDYSNTGELKPEKGKPHAAVRAMGAEPIVQVYLLGYLAGDRTWGSVKVDPVRLSANMVRDLNIKKKAKIKYWALDNEPDCWMTTHKDVFKHKLGYDEYLDVYLRAARAMKAVDPSIKLLGPVAANLWFFYNLNREEDPKEKGPWLPYFLKKCAEHDKAWGKRSLDYLDIHRYPEGSFDEQKVLEIWREWWDPTYTKDPIVPTMKKWIDEFYPGTKLAITEYGLWHRRPLCQLIWLTQAMGAFGITGVDDANKWGVIQPEEMIFGLYGNIFGDTAITVDVSDSSIVDCLASEDSKTGDRILVLINKSLTEPVSITLDAQIQSSTKDWYAITEDAAQKPVFTHHQKESFDGLPELPPLSITFLRLWSQKTGARGDFKPIIPKSTLKTELAWKNDGGGYPFGPKSNYHFYHASIITRDATGFDLFKGSGDTGLGRGGARDQVATDLTRSRNGKVPEGALVWFDDSNRITKSGKTDSLVFDWTHVNKGWIDVKIAFDLKWTPQDITPYLASNGHLVLYVKALIKGSDFTIYIPNNQTPERTISLLASDYVTGGVFSPSKKGWQEVKIPLKAFDIEEQGIDATRVRYIGFGNVPSPGKVKILVDDIMIIKGDA